MPTIFQPDPNPTLDDPAFTDARIRDQVLTARATAIIRECASGRSTHACIEFAKAVLQSHGRELARQERERFWLEARR